jgi:hypothetical protein
MKAISLFLGLWLCTHLLFAQQTFFTIPSGEITHKGKVFGQLQSNFTNPQGAQTKIDLMYGIGHHWEIGLNVDADLHWKRRRPFLEVEDSLGIHPVTPLLLFNMQKGIPILPHSHLRLNIGTQVGTNIINQGQMHLAYMGYMLLASEFMEDWHINLGTYLTNRSYAGDGSSWGLFGGIEIPFSERWALMSDATFGSNANCIATFGFSYNPFNRVQLCLGGMTSMPQNPVAQTGIIFELSIFGWDFWDKDEE